MTERKLWLGLIAQPHLGFLIRLACHSARPDGWLALLGYACLEIKVRVVEDMVLDILKCPISVIYFSLLMTTCDYNILW